MALPRQDLPGQPIHSIRRTNEGIYYLSPRRQCVRGLAYTYGLGIEASRAIPHAEMTMSNHRQGVLTCTNGARSKFHERHHGTFAEQYNGWLGRSGYMWDHRGPTDPVILGATEPTDATSKFCFAAGESKKLRERWLNRWEAAGLTDMERTIVYDLLNPVAANLVQHVRSFPGFKVGPADWGKWRLHERPHWMADGYQDTSAFIALPPPLYWDNAIRLPTGDSRFVVHPDLLEELDARRAWLKQQHATGSPLRGRSLEDFNRATAALFVSADSLEAATRRYNSLIGDFEEEFRQERVAANKRVKGRSRLIKQDPFRKPKGPSPIRRSRHKPRFVGPPERVKRANKAYRNFTLDHRDKLNSFRNDRDYSVEFPAGTVRMARISNVRCRGAPLPANNPML